MGSDSLDYTRGFLQESADVVRTALDTPAFLASIVTVAEVMETCLRQGGKLMFAGNGGSAGDAQHIAGEFVSRLNFDRAPLAGLALSTDTSVLTAIGNDYGYDKIFERQVLGLGNRGDIFVGISTSGRSPNILRGLEAARKKGIGTIGFTGRDPRDMTALCDHTLKAPSDSTPLIQQIHITAAHIVCGLVERAMFAPKAS
jgi:D-sedoheptulose 7-phosphate isomerase